MPCIALQDVGTVMTKKCTGITKHEKKRQEKQTQNKMKKKQVNQHAQIPENNVFKGI